MIAITLTPSVRITAGGGSPPGFTLEARGPDNTWAVVARRETLAGAALLGPRLGLCGLDDLAPVTQILGGLRALQGAGERLLASCDRLLALEAGILARCQNRIQATR